MALLLHQIVLCATLIVIPLWLEAWVMSTSFRVSSFPEGKLRVAVYGTCALLSVLYAFLAVRNARLLRRLAVSAASALYLFYGWTSAFLRSAANAHSPDHVGVLMALALFVVFVLAPLLQVRHLEPHVERAVRSATSSEPASHRSKPGDDDRLRNAARSAGEAALLLDGAGVELLALQRVSDEGVGSAQKHSEALERERDGAVARATQLEKELAGARAAAEADLRAAKKRAAELDSEITRARAQQQQQASARDAADKELRAAKARAQEVNAELASLRAELAQANKTRDASGKDLHVAQARVASLQADLDAERARAQTSAAALSKAEGELRDANQRVEALTMEVGGGRAQDASRAATAEAGLREASERLLAAEAELDSLRAQLSAQRVGSDQHATRVREQHDASAREHSEREAELKKTADKIAHLEQNNAEALEKYQESLKHLHSERDALSAELGKLRQASHAAERGWVRVGAAVRKMCREVMTGLEVARTEIPGVTSVSSPARERSAAVDEDVSWLRTWSKTDVLSPPTADECVKALEVAERLLRTTTVLQRANVSDMQDTLRRLRESVAVMQQQSAEVMQVNEFDQSAEAIAGTAAQPLTAELPSSAQRLSGFEEVIELLNGAVDKRDGEQRVPADVVERVRSWFQSLKPSLGVRAQLNSAGVWSVLDAYDGWDAVRQGIAKGCKLTRINEKQLTQESNCLKQIVDALRVGETVWVNFDEASGETRTVAVLVTSWELNADALSVLQRVLDKGLVTSDDVGRLVKSFTSTKERKQASSNAGSPVPSRSGSAAALARSSSSTGVGAGTASKPAAAAAQRSAGTGRGAKPRRS